MSAAVKELDGLPSFGRYEPRFRIASGGMAEVYGALARGDEGFERWIALKRMLRHVSEEPRFEEMFLDEGRLAAQIVSPYVVSTLDLGRASDGSAYLVMDLVIGATLAQLTRAAAKSGGIPTPIAVEILAQAAQGLHDAHEARNTSGQALDIVHRDVSPQNILVGIDGRARISDFGVARAAQRESHTRTGEVKGKLAYFSPEQAAADEVDRRTDLFSLGIIAWEVLARQRLFHADNPLGVLKRVVEHPIPRLDTIAPHVSPALADVVARALDRDREGRWPTGAALAAALRATLAEAPGDIGAYVAANARESVDRILDGMRAPATTSPAAAPLLESVELATTPAGLRRPSGPREIGRASTSAETIDAEIPIDVSISQRTAPTVAATRPATRSPWLVGSVLVSLVLAGIALAAWAQVPATASDAVPVASSGTDDTVPAATHAPTPEPTTTDGPPQTALVGPEIAPAVVSSPDAEDTSHPSRHARSHHAAATLAEVGHPSQTAPAPSAPPPTTEAPTVTAPAPAPEARHGGLLDVDQFERTLPPSP